MAGRPSRLAIDVTKPMRGLSIADQQMVEIARALASDSRLITIGENDAINTQAELATFDQSNIADFDF